MWTGLTELTHFDAIVFNVCHNPENKKVGPRGHMWKPARQVNSTLDVRPELRVLFVPVHQLLLDKESCQAGAEIKT